MQVKKFEAPTIQDALKVIKQEMGPDAIILSTKENRKGFGLMKKGSVEVTAAVSKRDLEKKKAAEKLLPDDVKQKIWSSKASAQKSVYDDYFERQLSKNSKEKVEISTKSRNEQKTKPHEFTQKRYAEITDEDAANEAPEKSRSRLEPIPRSILAQTGVDKPGAAPAEVGRVRELEQEVDDLKNMIRQIASQRLPATADLKESETDSDAVNETYATLVQAGIEKRYARELVKTAEFELPEAQKSNPDAIQERLAMVLMERLQVTDVLKNLTEGKTGGTKFLVIVGPTGVGKTTTAAKITSQALLDRRLRVGMINLDSYRVGAADQLATYAKLMNCPFRSVTTQSELQQAAFDFANLDLVIVDTTGRSQKDQASLAEMKSMISVLDGASILLTLSATTRETDLNDITARFRIFNPQGLIFSKLDETTMYGPIYNTHQRTKIPLAYFTVGQRVPEDIERASTERVAALILDL